MPVILCIVFGFVLLAALGYFSGVFEEGSYLWKGLTIRSRVQRIQSWVYIAVAATATAAVLGTIAMSFVQWIGREVTLRRVQKLLVSLRLRSLQPFARADKRQRAAEKKR